MKKLVIVFIAVLFAVVGCAPKAVEVAPKPTVTTPQDRALTDAERAKIIEEELARAERDRLLREQERLASILQDINFDFDSYTINSSELPKIEGVGSWMRQEREVRIIIEGHCDERGTVEYNLALGQKRAEVVKDYLLKMGISGNRIRTVSYGKEIPVDLGSSEDAWARNRRAHFRIDQRG